MSNPFLPQDSSSKNDSSSQKQAADRPAQITVRRGTPWWVGASFGVIVVALIVLGVQQHQANADLIGKLEQSNSMLTTLDSRTANLETHYTDLRADTDTVTEKLGVTQKDLDKARAAAWRIRKEQEKTAEELNAKLSEHATAIDSINSEVGEVRDNVSETQQDLEQTQAKLSNAMGDLGMQSGLIARNHDELEELKRRGERDYVEFNIPKSKQYSKVGSLSVRLNKTDTKRNRFTLTVLQNDKRIEKKDRTIYEPVQFYTGQKGQLLELVVFDLDKNHVSGYLSLPKSEIARNQTP